MSRLQRFLIGGAFSLALFGHQHLKTAHASDVNMNPAYDLSQWQTQFTDAQVQQLKSETSFVILRVQYGQSLRDSAFVNNLALIQKYKIPYGVYSYSMYNSNAVAQSEARQLYQLAPHALFYVNDLEENHMGDTNSLNTATKLWAQTINAYTKRPVVLYSGLSFMDNYIGDAKNSYNALWIASYSDYEPNPQYHYDLWQYTDKKYSPALNQNVDASIIPAGGQSLSFWTNSGQHKSKKTRKIKVHPQVTKVKSKTKQPKAVKKITPTKQHKQAKTKAKSKVKSHKAVAKVDPHLYYTNAQIKELQVISNTGVSVYNRYGQQVMQCIKGNVIAVKYFKQVGHIMRAITPNGNYFTANKKLVSATIHK